MVDGPNACRGRLAERLSRPAAGSSRWVGHFRFDAERCLGPVGGASATISGQQIPEGGAITSASLNSGRVSPKSPGNAANCDQLVEFAADVESAQNAVRDLLSRLSPSGMFDGLKALFTGDALENSGRSLSTSRRSSTT